MGLPPWIADSQPSIGAVAKLDVVGSGQYCMRSNYVHPHLTTFPPGSQPLPLYRFLTVLACEYRVRMLQNATECDDLRIVIGGANMLALNGFRAFRLVFGGLLLTGLL